MLANKGCFNPTTGAGTRWSMYSYNLQLADDGTANYSYATPRLYLGNLLKSLYTDLVDVQRAWSAPMSMPSATCRSIPRPRRHCRASACATLESKWVGTQDKLFKCIDAATDPKQSQLDQNCGAFDAQFPSYRSFAAGLTPTGADPANRVGEISSRLDVIRHVFYDHFVNAPLSQ